MVYFIIRNLARLVLMIFFRARIVGVEKIPKSGPLIVASNHASMMDPLLVGAFVNRKVHYMAKEELFPNAFATWFMRNIAVFPVARGKGDRGAIKMALEVLESGEAMGIFPEGTRTEDGTLQQAQPGTAMLVAKSGAPVLTVACMGTYKAFPKGAKFPKFAKVELRVGELFTAKDLGLESSSESSTKASDGDENSEKTKDRKDNRKRMNAAGEMIMASIRRLIEG